MLKREGVSAWLHLSTEGQIYQTISMCAQTASMNITTGKPILTASKLQMLHGAPIGGDFLHGANTEFDVGVDVITCHFTVAHVGFDTFGNHRLIGDQ